MKNIKLSYKNYKEYEQKTKFKTLKESLERVFNDNFIDAKIING